MKQLGQANVAFPGLFNVLSGKPNLNALTTYTSLMHVATGVLTAAASVGGVVVVVVVVVVIK
jgi:hypothetical protein